MSEETQAPIESGEHGRSDASERALTPGAGYPFSVLGVLRTALHVTKRNFAAFFVLACVLEAPAVLLQLAGTGEDVGLALVVELLTNALASAVVTYGVIMELHGSRPSTRTCIATGFAQLGRVLRVTLVSTLAILGAMLLLVIPGVIVALMFYVIVPVTVVEHVGIRTAMKRSRELTHGRKADLFLIMLFGAGVGVAIELVAHYQLGPDTAFVWRALGSALSSMFFAVTAAVVYVELRKLRDGTRVPELATAFARFRK